MIASDMPTRSGWTAVLAALLACGGSGCSSQPSPARTADGATAGAGSAAVSGAGHGAGASPSGVAGTGPGSAASGGGGGAAAGQPAAAGNGSGGGGGTAASGALDAGSAGTVGPDAGRGTEPSAGGDLVWPNDESKANSDPWLVAHHDEIAQLQPRVLVIDLESTDETKATTLVDRHIAALEEASSFHKYREPDARPALAYQLVKIARASKGSRIDYGSWNTQSFADQNLQLKDPADPDGPNLTLCGLFERGVINEVWCMASANPKCGETQEAKQVYDASGRPMANRFANVSNGDSITDLGCKVTVRVTDFNSGRGTGCHQHAMGHAWERYMESNAVPQLAKQAKRFLNMDLDTRAGAPFRSFYQACNSNSMQLTDCIVWESEIRARSGASAAQTFDLADLSAGCGNAHFYPNTTGTYSYDANTPDPEVQTSCEHYGMHDGEDGKDLTTPYTNAMTDQYYGRSTQNCPAEQPACDDDCGGHGTTYLYQNFPGPGTTATDDDGTPMHNWWVYLFY